jgi:hypothetical protein
MQICAKTSIAGVSWVMMHALIKAAKACQDLARSLETQEIIPGFLVYTDKPV